MRGGFLLPFVLVMSFSSIEAEAEPVRINFLIETTSTLGDLRDVLGVAVSPGDVVPGTLVYDAAAPNTLPPNQDFGVFRSDGAINLLAGSRLRVPLVDIAVGDNPLPIDDEFAPSAVADAFPGFDFLFAEMDFRLAGRTGVKLPATAAELISSFSSGHFTLTALKTGAPPGSGATHVLGGLVRLVDSSNPIPEPGTLLLFATAAAAISRRAWKRRATTELR
jgi:hypothetical protein